MSKRETVTYHCERCDKSLRGHHHELNIVTSLNEAGYWSRLHVVINHHHGVHNDGKMEPADLCHKCAILLLKDALKRVQDGERASAGAEGIETGRWGKG